MTEKRELGNKGEDAACAFLEKKGLQVLARNFHCRAGEIDVIARDGDTVAFVEVKTRRGRLFGSAAEAVTPAKRRKLTRAAMEYIDRNGLYGENFRFDIMEVYPQGKCFDINHIENAFEAEEG